MGLVESGGKSSNITENSRDKEERTSLINLEFARIEGSRLCLIVYVGKLQHSLQEKHFSGREGMLYARNKYHLLFHAVNLACCSLNSVLV